MPSNWLYIDTNFPTFTGEESTNEKISTIQNYLFMLVEQLRYTLHNLDLDNMNKTAVERYEKYLTDPLYGRIEDTEGHLNEFQITAEGYFLRVENAEGDINQLQITAQGLRADLTNAQGDITSLQVTARGLRADITDAQGNITSLQATAQGLRADISNAQGDITSLQATATGLRADISNAQGDITTLQATAKGLRADITDAQGNITSLQATATSLSATLKNAQGDITNLQATAQGLQTSVSNMNGAITTLTQTVNGFRLSASNSLTGTSSTLTLTSNGAYISSATISFNGLVTFTSLETAGMTSINGANLQTGTVTAWKLKGETVSLLTSWGESVGGISITGTQSWSGYGLEIYTSNGNGGIRIDSGSGAFWVDANGGVSYFGGSLGVSDSGITCGGDTLPFSNGRFSLGNGGLKWSDVYASNGTIQTSDRNQKTDIEALPEKYLTLFDGIQPVRFRRVDGTSGRYHTGFVAQQVKEAMDAAGVDSLELAAYVEDRDQEGNDIFMLRYEELIALLWAKVKRLEQQING